VASRSPKNRHVEARPLEQFLGLERVEVELGHRAGVEPKQPTAELRVEQPAVLRDDVPVALGLPVLDDSKLEGA
jgi:hypothetical protein